MDKKKKWMYLSLIAVIIALSIAMPYVIRRISDAAVEKILESAETETEPGTEPSSEPETEPGTEPSSEPETETGTESNSEPETETGTEPWADTGDEPDSADGGRTADGSGIKESGSGSPEDSGTSPGSASGAAGGTSEGSADASGENAEPGNMDRYADIDDYLEKMAAYAEDFSIEITVKDAAAAVWEDFIGDREAAFQEAWGEYLYSVYGGYVVFDRIEIVEEVRNNEEECSCQVVLCAESANWSEYYIYICSYNKTYDYYGIYPLYRP